MQAYDSHHEVNDGVICAIYLRTTPTAHELEELDEEGTGRGRKYLGEPSLPVQQSSGCLAAMLFVGEDRGVTFSAAALLNDKRKLMSNVKRPEFMKLMTTLCSCKIKFLFMDTMNRASGKLAQNLLLIKVCQLVKAKIVLKKILVKRTWFQKMALTLNGTQPPWTSLRWMPLVW